MGGVRGLLTHGHRYTAHQNDRVPRRDPKANTLGKVRRGAERLATRRPIISFNCHPQTHVDTEGWFFSLPVPHALGHTRRSPLDNQLASCWRFSSAGGAHDEETRSTSSRMRLILDEAFVAQFAWKVRTEHQSTSAQPRSGSAGSVKQLE